MSQGMADIFDMSGTGAPGGGMPQGANWMSLLGGYLFPSLNGLLAPPGSVPNNPFGISATPIGQTQPGIPPVPPPGQPPVQPPVAPPPGGGGVLAPPGMPPMLPPILRSMLGTGQGGTRGGGGGGAGFGGGLSSGQASGLGGGKISVGY